MEAEVTPGAWAHLLYGDALGPLSIFTKSTTGTTRVAWATPDTIDATVAALEPGDVWLGCATRRERLTAGRGGEADCFEVPGLWLDVDIAGPNHVAPNLPANIAEAVELIASFPLKPTAVIESGGGLQAWWLFPELIDAADVKPILEQWATTWKELGRRRGWHVDNVFDLARIMRLPGTGNHKADPPQPVKVSRLRPERRYGLDDFEPHMLAAPTPPAPERAAYEGGERTGDRYNAATDPASLLVAHGCVFDHEASGERHYRAPHHAGDTTTGIVVYADGHTTVYSETFAGTHGLEVRRPYDAFGLLTHLEHHGSFEAARDALEPIEPYAEPRDLIAGVTPRPMPVTGDPDSRLRLVSLAGLQLRPTHWLWDMYLPAGQISLLAGREGIGKSTIALERAALITRGELPGQGYGRARDVVIVATEDSFEHTIGPRLVAHGAALDHVYRVEMTAEYAALAFPGDLPALEAACQGHDVALIILDPLLSRLSARLDSHVDGQVRQALEPLGALADRLGANVWGLIHVNKSGSTHPLDAIMASRAFTAFARSVIFAIEDPEQDARFALGVVKSNLGSKAQPTLTYAIDGIKVAETDEGDVWTSRIVWGEPTPRSIEEMLSTQAGARSAEELAADWLRKFLDEKGQYPASAIKTAALKEGHAWRTVERARKRAGVIMEKVGMPGVSYWRLNFLLPEAVVAVTEAPSRAGNPPLASLGASGTLASHEAPRGAKTGLGPDLAPQADHPFDHLP